MRKAIPVLQTTLPFSLTRAAPPPALAMHYDDSSFLVFGHRFLTQAIDTYVLFIPLAKPVTHNRLLVLPPKDAHSGHF